MKKKPLPVKRITVVARFGLKSRSCECLTNREACCVASYELGRGATKITLAVNWVKPENAAGERRREDEHGNH